MLYGDPKNGSAPLSDQEVIVEVMGFTFAATDTTSNATTYLIYELARHPEWQEKVRDELKQAKVEENDYDSPTLKELPILNACMHESIRLNPPVMDGLPRITPPEGVTIDGIFVPGNVHVSVAPFDSQRNPSIFPKPDIFDPSRWLITSSLKTPSEKFSTKENYGTQEMRDAILVWGKGNRACLGQTMALMNVRLVVSKILCNLRVRLASKQTLDDMVHTAHLALIPKGMKCMLVFEDVVA
jgi:cytochrome P450